jgi:hypothetical protein
MTDREQAVIDAARALMAYDVGGAFEKWIEWDPKFETLRSALAALDAEPTTILCDPECVHCATWRDGPTYRERMARLYRGEDK